MFDIRKIQEDVIFNAVKAASDDKTASAIVYGENGLSSPEDDPAWVKFTVRRLENRFDKAVVRQIRMSCQCGHGMDERLAFVKELAEASSDLEEFANQKKAKAAGLYCENGELFLQFAFCPCPMLSEVDRLDTDTWCQCTTGYSKFLFEKAFGCAVDVELLKSIKMGDDVCLQKIIPHGSIWK